MPTSPSLFQLATDSFFKQLAQDSYRNDDLLSKKIYQGESQSNLLQWLGEQKSKVGTYQSLEALCWRDDPDLLVALLTAPESQAWAADLAQYLCDRGQQSVNRLMTHLADCGAILCGAELWPRLPPDQKGDFLYALCRSYCPDESPLRRGIGRHPLKPPKPALSDQRCLALAQLFSDAIPLLSPSSTGKQFCHRSIDAAACQGLFHLCNLSPELTQSIVKFTARLPKNDVAGLTATLWESLCGSYEVPLALLPNHWGALGQLFSKRLLRAPIRLLNRQELSPLWLVAGLCEPSGFSQLMRQCPPIAAHVPQTQSIPNFDPAQWMDLAQSHCLKAGKTLLPLLKSCSQRIEKARQDHPTELLPHSAALKEAEVALREGQFPPKELIDSWRSLFSPKKLSPLDLCGLFDGSLDPIKAYKNSLVLGFDSDTLLQSPYIHPTLLARVEEYLVAEAARQPCTHKSRPSL